jgi:hypothetical protein
MSKVITLQELARFLKIDVGTANRHVTAVELPCFKVGKSVSLHEGRYREPDDEHRTTGQ